MAGSGDYARSGWKWEAGQTLQSISKEQNEPIVCMAALMTSGWFFLLFNHLRPLQISSGEGRVEYRCKILNLVLGR